VNATAKFYAGFVIALAIVIALAYYAGLRAGSASTHVRAHATASPSP
jgi:hypothetical protein